MIYFIQAGENGPIKIGYVMTEDRGDVELRLADLQTANPEQLVVRGVMLGGLDDEMALHARFASGRLRGEWFAADTPGLAEVIEEANRTENVVAWQLRDDGVQLCEWCEANVVEPPRRTICSDECAADRKAFRAANRGFFSLRVVVGEDLEVADLQGDRRA